MQLCSRNRLTGDFEGNQFSDLLQTKNSILHLFFLWVKTPLRVLFVPEHKQPIALTLLLSYRLNQLSSQTPFPI